MPVTSIITLLSTDALYPLSLNNINANFAALNAGKLDVFNNLSDVANAATAINNIMPSQTGNNGKFLITNGSAISWGSPSGIPTASTTVLGIAEISATPVDPLIPIALGVNDLRCIPAGVSVASITQDLINAIAGTGVPSASNKFVTNDTLTTFEALAELLANKDATITLGTSDTKYPSQKAVKTYVDNQTTNVYLGSQALSDGANTITAGYQSAWRYAIIVMAGGTTASSWNAEVFVFKSGKTSGTFNFVLVTTATGGSASVSGTTMTLSKSGSTIIISATAYYYQ